MTTDNSFSIVFDPQTCAADREVLLSVLRAYADDVQEAPSKAIDWATFVVIMGDVGAVAGGTSALIALGKQLWRASKAMRERGRTVAGRLDRPGQPPLDLATATEEELLAWLIQNQPERTARS
jgi:hypothetical protein